MAHGRLLKSKVKEAKGIAQALMKGIQKADEAKPLEEHIKEHLGRMIDRVDPLELAIYAGLTYAGYEIFKDWKGALVGPVGLKLATSPNEISAGVGCAMLATLGIGVILPSIIDIYNESVKEFNARKATVEGLRKKIQDNGWPSPHFDEWFYYYAVGRYGTKTELTYCDWIDKEYPKEKPGWCGTGGTIG